MIILDTTTKSLEIVLSGAITTNQLPWVVSYVDTGATPPLAEADGATNSGTAVTMVSAPSSGKAKIIKNVSIYNADTVDATVTVRYNNNGTTRLMIKATIPTGYRLQFTDEGGWQVNDTAGLTPGSVSGSAGGDLTGTYPNPTIGTNKVQNTQFRQSGALAVVGRSANSTGNIADIQATAASGGVLRESGSTIGFGTIATAGITDAAVTLAKIANAAASSKLLGSGASGSGAAYSEITLGTGLSMSGTTLNAAATSKPFLQWTAAGNAPPASAYATPDTRNNHMVLDFDGSTDEEAIFAGVLPTAYASGGLTCETWWSFTSATSGNLRVQAAIERMDVSSLGIDADSFASFQSAGGTAPGTSGQFVKVTITFTDGAQMDSLAAGEAFRLKIRRDADGTSGTDDITTDAELLRVVMRET